MTAVVAAGLTGVQLIALALIAVSAIACVVFCATRRRPEPDPALKPAVDAHWEPTAKGKAWRGSTFVRPGAERNSESK